MGKSKPQAEITEKWEDPKVGRQEKRVRVVKKILRGDRSMVWKWQWGKRKMSFPAPSLVVWSEGIRRK